MTHESMPRRIARAALVAEAASQLLRDVGLNGPAAKAIKMVAHELKSDANTLAGPDEDFGTLEIELMADGWSPVEVVHGKTDYHGDRKRRAAAPAPGDGNAP